MRYAILQNFTGQATDQERQHYPGGKGRGKAEVGGRKDRSQMSEVRGQEKTEDGKTEVRCQRTDVRKRRRSEIRGQMSEVGSRMVDTRVMEELAHVLMPGQKVVLKSHF